MRRREIYTFGFRGFPSVQGGIETHAEQLAPRLVDLGYRVTACTRSPYIAAAADRAWKGVNLLRLWTIRNKHAEALVHSVVCAIVAGFRRPEIVHVHGIGPALVTPLLRLFGLRVVVTHHGEDYNREKWGFSGTVSAPRRRICRNALFHKRIAVSRSIETLIATKYGKECEVIPNGVVFSELPLQSDKIRELGLEPGKYILTVGRLVPEKRQLDLLRAFREAKLSGWKLAIVGKIERGDVYVDFLMEQARESENVVMAGYQSGETLRQLYAHAGLFVLPSSHEGLPIVLLEALSYGLPSLVSDIPSSLEVISDPDCVFKLGNIEDLSSKLVSLTAVQRDASTRDAMRRENARRYDWGDIAVKTAATYSDLIGSLRPVGSRPATSRAEPAVGGVLTDLGSVSGLMHRMPNKPGV